MSERRHPKGFAPGARLESHHSRMLLEAGFIAGYPVFSTSNGGEADDLQFIIHALTYPPLGHRDASLPIMPLGVLVPDGSGYGEIRHVPITLAEITRRWSASGAPYWLLNGDAHFEDSEQRWFVNRRLVEVCEVHVLLKDPYNYEAYVQLVPVGVSTGEPIPIGPPADLRWGDPSSKTLPPQPQK